MPSVAAVAPAKVLTTSPTDLHHCLRRLADGSRAPTPEGSLPAFAWGPLATPIRPITGRLSLVPSSFTRSPIGSPCGALSLAGGLRAYHVASLKLCCSSRGGDNTCCSASSLLPRRASLVTGRCEALGTTYPHPTGWRPKCEPRSRLPAPRRLGTRSAWYGQPR